MNVLSFPHPVASGPILSSGDRLSQTEFHRRYLGYPKEFKAELAQGVVYVASPVGLEHGRFDFLLSGLVMLYAANTPGTQGAHNATIELSAADEFQPDLLLRVLPECGGSSRVENNFVVGPPELILEVAHSSVSIDLHEKLHAYRAAGVQEYLVFCVAERLLKWFLLPTGQESPLPADGVVRSTAFPGLWIDSGALAAEDSPRLLANVQAGLASPEHAQFVQRLAAARTPEAPR